MIRFLCLFVLLAGCATPAASRSAPPAPAPTTPTRIGYSVQGRPIEIHHVTPGDRPVLILAAIHGNEPTSATVANGLLQHLRQSPSPTPVSIILVANPDGYAARTRTNSRNIDLNRNFPAKNFGTRAATRARRNAGGLTPASEPETIALIQIIDQLCPRLIISIHSMERPCNNYDGPAKEIAELMSRYNHYPAVPTIGYPTPGSMGSYAGIDKQIPMITLELPRKQDGAQAFLDNRDALLAAIASSR